MPDNPDKTIYDKKRDKIDLLILKHLQEDGRMTNVELAKLVGISAPPCLRRVRFLEESGVIQGYHAQLNPEALGFGVIVFAKVGLETQNEQDLQAFEEQVRQWSWVRECYLVAGDADFFLKIVAKDWDDYQKLLSLSLRSAKHIKSVKTQLVIRTSKYQPGIPIEE